MQSYFVNFKQSFMTTSLLERKKVSEDNLGITLALAALFYIISCNIVSRLINLAPKRVFILFCFIFITISNLLMGPSDALGLEKYFLPLFFIGQGLNGFSQGFLLTPALPEIIDAVYAKQKLTEGEDDVVDAIVSDRASGIFGLFFAAGTISAPLVGSLVYERLLSKNWAQTCDTFGAVGAIYSLIFLLFNVLPDIHLEDEEKEELIERMIAQPLVLERLKTVEGNKDRKSQKPLKQEQMQIESRIN
jgi:MFS family permease